jgi:uncharacterized membrane protein
MGASERRGAVAEYWPLALLMALAVSVRFATLDQQSLWYDEAVTAVRVLHPSLGSTLSAVVHVENTPPLYYLLAWGWTRVLGTGVFALRSLSALAGVATVAVAWAIGHELGSRRAAIVLAAIAPAIRCSSGTRRRLVHTSCSCCSPRSRFCTSCERGRHLRGATSRPGRCAPLSRS